MNFKFPEEFSLFPDILSNVAFPPESIIMISGVMLKEVLFISRKIGFNYFSLIIYNKE